jgi:hypothetical protein
MTRIHRVKVALIAIGILAVLAIGIALIPKQNSTGLHTGNPQSGPSVTEGDSSPQPVTTVTRYAPAPTKSPSASPRIVEVPGPAVTHYVPGPTVTKYVSRARPAKTKYVETPGPTVTVTESPIPTP